MENLIAIGSVLAAILTAIGGTYIAESIRKKNESEAANILVEGALKLVDAKDKELEDLKKDQTILRLYAGYLQGGVELLRQQLIKDGKIPAFDPQPLNEYKK